MPEKQSETLNELKKLYRTRFPGQFVLIIIMQQPRGQAASDGPAAGI